MSASCRYGPIFGVSAPPRALMAASISDWQDGMRRRAEDPPHARCVIASLLEPGSRAEHTSGS